MGKITTQSPFAPKNPLTMPTLEGFSLAVGTSGARYQNRPDLLVALCDPNTSMAACFTRSQTAAVPVDWSKQLLAEHASQGKSVRGLLVNAGHANAFTGKAGHVAATYTAKAVAENLMDAMPDSIALASTGVIGVVPPHEKITPLLPHLVAEAKIRNKVTHEDWHRASQAILTTDTYAKLAKAKATIGGVTVNLVGIAKGSGMIAPDMATMICLLFTDAAVPQHLLQKWLSQAVNQSFNSITVDNDCSTNDTVMLWASGAALNPIPHEHENKEWLSFRRALDTISRDLALQVVLDGEGISKLITVNVRGAKTAKAAKIIGLSVANSPLVKTAVAGGDANWGRVVMAVGKSGEQVDRDRLSISFGGIKVAHEGAVVEAYDESPVAAHFQGRDIVIDIDIGLGRGKAKVWGCDLTHGYIDINADYRS